VFVSEETIPGLKKSCSTLEVMAGTPVYRPPKGVRMTVNDFQDHVSRKHRVSISKKPTIRHRATPSLFSISSRN
jgi:hypothetical protein